MTRGMLRLLMAEGSPTRERDLRNALADAPDITIAGIAHTTQQAVDQVRALRPDLVTVSVHEGQPDGVALTRRLMTELPIPIVVLADQRIDEQVRATMRALEAGALAAAPIGTDLDERGRRQLVATLRAMAGTKMVRRWSGRDGAPPEATARAGAAEGAVVAIAASTGGPAVLRRILSGLPERFAHPVLLVQHISAGFSGGLIDWLRETTRLRVTAGRAGDILQPGTVYVAGDGAHMGVSPTGAVQLSGDEPIGGFRPSATYLFRSVAAVYGRRAAGLILSGMGDDGVAGLVELSRAGGHVIAQDAESCVVFGMPRVAAAAGIVNTVLAPHAIPDELQRWSLALRKSA